MMKTYYTIPISSHARYWLLIVNFLMLFLVVSCGGSSSSDDPEFTPKNTLEGKLFVLGSRVDTTGSGDYLMYVSGTDLAGVPLTLAQLQTAKVIVDGVNYTAGDGNLTIADVTDHEPILSVGLVTDWSNSTNGELAYVGAIFSDVLDNLPPVFEAQIMTFSDSYFIQQDWTSDVALLKAALAKPHPVRNKTALFDSMGVAFEGDVYEGLVDRCRPAHMLVVFTDGDDNMSHIYTASHLASIANQDRATVIMLATSDAIPGVLTTLAADYGAVVQVNDPSGLPVEVANWSASLNHLAVFTLKSAIDITGKTVTIKLGTQTVVAVPNAHCP